eukprot:1000376_1
MSNNTEEVTEQLLLARYKMYRYAAKKQKEEGNKIEAIKYLKQSKIISQYIQQFRNGTNISINNIPPMLDAELWSNDSQTLLFVLLEKLNESDTEQLQLYIFKAHQTLRAIYNETITSKTP